MRDTARGPTFGVMPLSGVAAEAPCADCIAHGGLCAVHARHVLPQLAQPAWIRMIGEGYLCERPECHGHERCTDAPGVAAPRAGCQCHACVQLRAHRVVARQALEVDPEAEKVKRRKARKAARAVDRLQRALAGEFTPARPTRRVA